LPVRSYRLLQPLDCQCQQIQLIDLRQPQQRAVAVDTVRAAMACRADRDGEEVAGPLAHALPFADVMHLGLLIALPQRVAESAAQGGNAVKVALLCTGVCLLRHQSTSPDAW